MEFALIVYVIGTVFPALIGLGATAGGIVIGVIVLGCCGAPFLLDEDSENLQAKYKSLVKTVFKWCIPVAIICAFIPDKDVSYTMIAAYAAQEVSQNEKVQSIAGESLELVEAFIKKQKVEIEKESKE
jgi:hypothetical protein